jgi:hypothetical protein
MVHAGDWTCQSLRKGVFIAGAVFVVLKPQRRHDWLCMRDLDEEAYFYVWYCL